MARNFQINLDLNKNQLIEAVVEKSAAAPSSPTTGQIWYDTNTNIFKVYNGDVWINAPILYAANTTERASLSYAKGNLLFLEDNGSAKWEFSIAKSTTDGTYANTVFEAIITEEIRDKADSTSWFLSTVTPPVLTGDVDDYSPVGLQPEALLKIDPGLVMRDITGIDSTLFSDGDMLYISNISSNRVLRLIDNDGASLAANRFFFSGNLSIQPNMGCVLYYDATDSKFRTISEFKS
jgi:hypothetical protein